MIGPQPRLLGAHLRRNLVAYVALIGMVALSPVPSMAADLVTTDDMADGAVTTPKLATNSVTSTKVTNGSVTSADIRDEGVTVTDLDPRARGARVSRYDIGAHDFAANPVLAIDLPDGLSAASIRASSWTANLVYLDSEFGDTDLIVPGWGWGGASAYRVAVGEYGSAFIMLVSGPGEAYDQIRLFRTTPTSTQAVG